MVENAREKTYEKWIIKSGKKKGTTEQNIEHETRQSPIRRALSTGGRKRKSSGRSEEAEGESERE